MVKGDKCPYCEGRCKKVTARVVRQPSHLAFGYGERIFRCVKCGSEHGVRYSIPPKGISKGMPDPNPGILRVTIRQGISGFASPVVLTAENPLFKKVVSLDTSEFVPAEESKESVA
ncbi:MAG TPA: hypothetical protein ENN67_02025 [Firmicutes bacterium]|nr:hypothetical protein [Bacillota bacterium]